MDSAACSPNHPRLMGDQTMEVPIALLAVLATFAATSAGGLVALQLRYRERLHRIEVARNDVLGRLALVAEYRDHRAREYARRLARTVGRIAEQMGIPAEEAREISLAAQFHDIGKVAIPDAVLLKPGELTPAERDVIESHTLVGAELLSGGPGILELAAEIALTHHERWDGSGYPHGLRGAEIPLAGRIVAVADAFHALIYGRPHRRAWPIEMAVAEVERSAGRHFDPDVVDAFSALRHHALAGRDRHDE